jgi:hypothetical protein
METYEQMTIDTNAVFASPYSVRTKWDHSEGRREMAHRIMYQMLEQGSCQRHRTAFYGSTSE